MLKFKICKKCKRKLNIANFYKTKYIKDGYENSCKECRNKQRPSYNLICKECNNSFKSKKRNQKYCSKKCADYARKRRIKTNCSYCSKEIEVTRYRYKTQDNHFCNKNCWSKYLSETTKGDNNPNFKRVEYKCDGCSKTILVEPNRIKKQKYIYCDNECYQKNIGKTIKGVKNPNYNREEIKCDYCNKTIKRIPSQIGDGYNFCSKECYNLFRVANTKGPQHEVKCDYCGITFKVYPSYMKNKTYIYCSQYCKDKGFSMYFSGPNSPMWNHELSEYERIINRKYEEYYIWREKVYKKNRYTCCKCRIDSGGNLNAHHIYNYSEYPNLRTDIDNGITLCKTCHKEFHDKFGYTKNNKKQIELFLKQTLLS